MKLGNTCNIFSSLYQNNIHPAVFNKNPTATISFANLPQRAGNP